MKIRLALIYALISPAKCNCEELGRKYEGFKRAIKDYTKSGQNINNINKEYQEWEKELRDAQIEGLQAFVNALAFEPQNLKKIREERFQGLRQELDKYKVCLTDEELLQKNIFLGAFMKRWPKPISIICGLRMLGKF